ncbi:hypothetical protein Droror1_Dr00000763 [Drosera rotundifolia]
MSCGAKSLTIEKWCFDTVGVCNIVPARCPHFFAVFIVVVKFLLLSVICLVNDFYRKPCSFIPAHLYVLLSFLTSLYYYFIDVYSIHTFDINACKARAHA